MADVTLANTSSNLDGKTVLAAENANTITGLQTFDRDPSAPFAVSASSAKVSNLDADLLDGEEGTAYHNAANLTGTVAAAVNWGGVTVPVNKGGTGATSLTDGGVMIGNGTSAVEVLSVAAANTVLRGVASSSPAFTSLCRVQSVADAATITPNADADDLVKITAIAQAFTIANPSGTPYEGQKLIVRIKDNGTARAITFGNQYRAMGVSLPTTTVISKTLYLGFIRNDTDTKWDLVASAQEA